MLENVEKFKIKTNALAAPNVYLIFIRRLHFANRIILVKFQILSAASMMITA